MHGPMNIKYTLLSPQGNDAQNLLLNDFLFLISQIKSKIINTLY